MVRDEHKCELAPWYNKNLRYALPIIIDDRYLLLAIWPTKLNKADSYIDICLDILNEYENKLTLYPTVIIGDYNIISTQKQSKPINAEELEDLKLLAGKTIRELSSEKYPGLLVFPRDFKSSENLDKDTILYSIEIKDNANTKGRINVSQFIQKDIPFAGHIAYSTREY